VEHIFPLVGIALLWFLFVGKRRGGSCGTGRNRWRAAWRAGSWAPEASNEPTNEPTASDLSTEDAPQEAPGTPASFAAAASSRPPRTNALHARTPIRGACEPMAPLTAQSALDARAALAPLPPLARKG